MSNKSLFCL